MSRFALIFHGGANPQSPEEGREVAAAWATWFTWLGDSLINMGNAFGELVTIESDGSTSPGGGEGSLSGYTLIRAESQEQAVALASECPILRYGGSIDVAELVTL